MITFPKKLDIAQLPTPIHLLEGTSAAWGGEHNIWIKRDDDTGGLVSGNKIRKLEFVVREALDLGADTLITCGGLQSNHCRATAAVARRCGLDVTLLLRGTAPHRPEGNYFLDRILGADIRFITPEQYERHDILMEEVAAELRENGSSPYVVAEGASMPMGAWGYIHACEEIAAAETDLGVRFDAIVSAAGSGGTSAGLELGKRLFNLEAKLWAVNVCDDEAYFRRTIHRLADETIRRFELPCTVAPEDIGIIDGYVGRGYALSRPEELLFITEMARREGIILDPAYTAKALFGLCNELKTPRFDNAENILFIHTGGIFGLFPKASEISF